MYIKNDISDFLKRIYYSIMYILLCDDNIIKNTSTDKNIGNNTHRSFQVK